MEFPFEITVNTLDETRRVAADFALLLKRGDVVAFIGNLGTGKTFFIKEVVKRFRIDEVTSPTFSIVNTYSGDVRINHFDFYRIKKEVELFDIGFEEYLNDPSVITFIEWADMFEDILPQNIYRVEILYQGETKRKIKINRK